MNNAPAGSLNARSAPPDQPQRDRALDPSRSILVQAPAGSGKTTLLTERFLRLLAEVDSPGQIVAITFTRAAAAEMRNRILDCLKDPEPDELARRVLEHSQALGWNLLDLPSQLRISTIDSFCRELALQQPLVSGLGGGLDVAEQSGDLYRRAARRTLQQIDSAAPALRDAIESLLLWRDNNWQEMETLLVEMLSSRDRWMHGFVLEREPDWDVLRARLERPFAKAVHATLTEISRLLDQVPNARQEALELARFACTGSGGAFHRELAELADFPAAPFAGSETLEEAREACICLAGLLLTKEGTFRKSINKSLGFPADRKQEKSRLLKLIAGLEAIPTFESALAAAGALPPARYTEEEWQIVHACFTLLRHAAAELKVVFAEAGAVDFTEVAQIALSVLKSEDSLPSEAAFTVAGGIRHLLVDEFQDTSRRQHQLLAHLIAAWPQPEGRTCFVVGDPMQSIYFFRHADAELFARIRDYGLELPDALLSDASLLFDHAPLSANFRTAPLLVTRLNNFFAPIFAQHDGSGIAFSPAAPARKLSVEQSKGTGFSPYIDEPKSRRALAPETPPFANSCEESHSQTCSYPGSHSHFNLHLNFVPQSAQRKDDSATGAADREAARTSQIEEIVSLIRAHQPAIESASARGEKYRIAILARTHSALAPIAQALREAQIPFRAVDLEALRDRPEVLDALALARALLNPYDRVSWLGVLRAPWCGLSLADLHTLTSADDPTLLARPIPDLLAERLHLLSEDGRAAVSRILTALPAEGPAVREAGATTVLGTRLEQIWLCLGGEACADATARANLNLLWRCLDRLPNGEQDLLGPALDAALEDLTAQSDPDAESDYGVQLMTIHKSKGLEFEMVIVPELQARVRASSFRMLTWLERGLAESDESGEITEFLIAPFQPKGAQRGKAKQWVDHVYRERELQEMRRILYVAATRAREELHFFARPAFKPEKDGSLVLAEPSNSLLATAWPALEEEVRLRFADWKNGAGKHELEIESIAASAQSNLLTMPSPAKPTSLRRLPPDFQPRQKAVDAPIPKQFLGAPGPAFGTWDGPLYSRHEGGLLSRVLGTAVHTLLEELARLRATSDWPAARAALEPLHPRIASEARAKGLSPAQAAGLAAQALELALNAAADPIGAWILSPHTEAQSETSWAGVVAGNLRTIRVDRVFQAGPVPGSEGEDFCWLIDYKTAHADDLDPAAALPALRRLFAPQLEAYAQVLRHLQGADTPIRTGLYYPRMAQFDWWQPE